VSENDKHVTIKRGRKLAINWMKGTSGEYSWCYCGLRTAMIDVLDVKCWTGLCSKLHATPIATEATCIPASLTRLILGLQCFQICGWFHEENVFCVVGYCFEGSCHTVHSEYWKMWNFCLVCYKHLRHYRYC